MDGWTATRRERVGTCLDLCIWRRKNRFVVSSVWTTPSSEAISTYCRVHSDFFHSYLADFAERPPKFRVAFVYDVRGLDAAPSEWMAAVMPFVSCHNALREQYKTHLHSTTVLLSPGVVRDLLNTLFTTVYLPARPVHFVADETDVSAVYEALGGGGEGGR